MTSELERRAEGTTGSRFTEQLGQNTMQQKESHENTYQVKENLALKYLFRLLEPDDIEL